ncbi:hypothetical protein VNO77_07739 [Canavalia gladiata]|uniref:Uncharacterized protein n=1 Tax=Canavalia gladiata TaxID=3824 RepID=A0AAN9QTI2_CANGL
MKEEILDNLANHRNLHFASCYCHIARSRAASSTLRPDCRVQRLAIARPSGESVKPILFVASSTFQSSTPVDYPWKHKPKSNLMNPQKF